MFVLMMIFVVFSVAMVLIKTSSLMKVSTQANKKSNEVMNEVNSTATDNVTIDWISE